MIFNCYKNRMHILLSNDDDFKIDIKITGIEIYTRNITDLKKIITGKQN